MNDDALLVPRYPDAPATVGTLPATGGDDGRSMPVPSARGPLSAAVRTVLMSPPGESASTADDSDRDVDWAAVNRAAADAPVDLTDDDVHVTLLMLYELHYRGLAGVSAHWEWHPDLLRVRRRLETRFEAALRAAVDVPPLHPDGVAPTLFAMTTPTPAPAVPRGTPRPPTLSGYMARQADRDQWRELLTVRSVYHLKEADPHTFAIPRLGGRPKAALVEIQADEYGGGRADRMHSRLFADTMTGLGLDNRYGALVDRVPGVVLAGVNAMSLFGLHRRLVGAAVGHLASIEMTSSLPSRLYGNGLRRLRCGPDVTRFYDEHVEADSVHEQIAAGDLAQGLAGQHPGTAVDILFGAAAGLHLDELAGHHLLGHFLAGTSALRDPEPGPAAGA